MSVIDPAEDGSAEGSCSGRARAAVAAASAWDRVVDLEHLKAVFLPAYGGDTWEEAVGYLMTRPAEREVVDALVEELATTTHFREPVRVGWDAEDARLGNGMHRIAAATIASRPTIRVTTKDDATYDDEAQTVEVTFTLDLANATIPGAQDDEDDLDYAATWLRSFQLTDGLWVETLACAGHGRLLECEWYCPHDLADDLISALRERCARHQVRLTVVSTSCQTAA